MLLKKQVQHSVHTTLAKTVPMQDLVGKAFYSGVLEACVHSREGVINALIGIYDHDKDMINLYTVIRDRSDIHELSIDPNRFIYYFLSPITVGLKDNAAAQLQSASIPLPINFRVYKELPTTTVGVFVCVSYVSSR